MTGNIDSNGNPDRYTQRKLRKALESAVVLRRSQRTCFYVFPDGRAINERRVCDVMKDMIEKSDEYRTGVQVPKIGDVSESVDDRQKFVNTVRRAAGSRIVDYITGH